MSDIKELIKSKLRPIGDAIREKNGSTELIPIDDMPQAIRDIKGGGGGLIEVTELPEVGEENTVYFIKGEPTFKLYSDVTGAGLVDMEEFASQMGMSMELVAVVDSPDQLPTDNIKISNGETEMFFYYVRNYGLYVYGPFSGDGNSWMNTSSMMPFGGEITSLDEIIVKDTVYVLVSGGKDSYYVYDNKLKPFPNKGTISEIYFNTSLSVDEVVAELSKLTLDKDVYVLGGSFETPCLLCITYDETAGWTIQDVFKNNIFFTSTYWGSINSEGWNHNLIKDGKYTFAEPIKLLTYNDDGDIIGAENFKITNVVRIFENKWTKISGGGATVKATPEVVPNTGFVERIYLNKSLTFDEVNAICTKANSFVANEIVPIYCVVSNDTFDKQLSTFKLTDHDGTTFNSIHYPNLGNVIWSERDYYNEEKDGSITQFKKGWMFEEDYVEINSEVVSFIEGDFAVNVGQHNDQLTELFSINNVFETNEIELTESYDGSSLVLSNKYVKKTVVPNEGYVERVYFNTSLSIDEVKAILEKFHTCVDVDTLDNAMWLINIDDYDNSSVTPEKLYWIMPSRDTGDYAILNALAQVIFKSDSSKWAGGDFVGWNPEFITAEKPYLEINSQVFPIVTENGNETKIGGFNDKIVDLFSLTPFEEKIYDSVEVDIKEMLKEKKLPLSIKVNVESESVNVVKGGGTVVPNSGYVENIYFNTNLSVEEVNAILKTIEYIPATNEGEPDIYIVLQTLDSLVSIFDYNNGSYAITVGMNVAYVSDESFASAGATFVGWNPDLTNPCVVNQESTFTDDFVLQNEKLTQLFSSTPFESKTIKTLEGDYEAVDLTFNELPSVWQDRVVPNSGYVERVYFNTELSVEEVVSLISGLIYYTLENQPITYSILASSDWLHTLNITNENGNYTILKYNRETNDLTIIWTNYEYSGDNLSGWREVAKNAISFECEVTNTGGTFDVGAENDKLIDLISIEPPLENTIDLEQYLDNKQMPMSVKVNVESQEPNLQEKEITENGEYVADEGYDGFSKVTVNVGGSSVSPMKLLLDGRKSADNLFNGFSGESIDDIISYSDTENVTSMNSMFNNCKALTAIPQLDTSKVTNMQNMFSNCQALETIQQLNLIKVSNANNVSDLFWYCKALTNLTLLNIKVNLQIGNGISWGHLLTLDSLINTVKELINVGSARILTMGTANLSKIASTYVKFTDSSVNSIPKNEKGDVVVCESTDEGAMLLSDYALLKNWTLA